MTGTLGSVDWTWADLGDDDDMTVPVLFDDGFESEPEGDDDSNE